METLLLELVSLHEVVKEYILKVHPKVRTKEIQLEMSPYVRASMVIFPPYEGNKSQRFFLMLIFLTAYAQELHTVKKGEIRFPLFL